MMEAQVALLCGRYELRGKLGHGGFGAVYEALDHQTGERVAIKELTKVDPHALVAFKREFRAVQELHHPNLVRLDALFEQDGKWLIAMELVEGNDLLSHVYVDGAQAYFDDRRLRAAFRELALALHAMHERGFVHRDLKPSNVRVTPSGRVVLLDFGLTVAADARSQATQYAGYGTVAYMAPEQAMGLHVGPAADWYAFGVCLYEALCGVLPIDGGTIFELLAAKQQRSAPPARALAPGVPDELDALCAALLARDAQKRPGCAEVLCALSGRAVPSRPGGAPQLGALTTCEGREAELEQLHAALREVQAGGAAVVLIEGDSGIGKTTLADHFLGLHEDAIVLRSRCYENELLGFKAFDGAVDALARELGRLPRDEAAALLPPRAVLLCRLFPTLGGLEALDQDILVGLSPDPNVQRLEAFAIFARLLANVAKRAPVLFAIDDLQWADAESFRLLFALLDTAPQRCMILATVRPRAELSGETAQAIEALRARERAQTICLTGLPPASASVFVRSLVGAGCPDARVQAIVRESGGHPLFITVLARHAETDSGARDTDLNLDAAIGARLGALRSDARRLLTAVALVGAPTSSLLCGRAAALDDEQLGSLTAELCRDQLLRRRGAGEIACFHDRIRHVLMQRLPAAHALELHRELARALSEVPAVDPAEVARHHEAAGEYALAHDAYVRGAERALEALAFARAALLYGRALEVSAHLQLGAARCAELTLAHADALARSGQSAEAAQQYAQAAQNTSGERQTRLRIFAAQHLLQSAHVEEGVAAARALLSGIGVPMPKGRVAIVARLSWDRALFALRRDLHTPKKTLAPARVRNQLEALSELALPLSWHDPVLAAAISARHARLASALGETTHLARALVETAFARLARNALDPEIDRLLAQARELCARCDDPALEVRLSFREANRAAMRWQLAEWRERLQHAEQVALSRCPGQPWLLTTTRISMGGALFLAGEHAQLATSSAAWLHDARDRNDQFATALLEGLGFGALRHLMRGDPELAEGALRAALGPWPREPFSFVHQGELGMQILIELYRGGTGAWDHLAREQPRTSRAFLLKTSFGKVNLAMWRGAAAVSAFDARDPVRADRTCAALRASILELEQAHKAGLGGLIAGSLSAQLSVLQGDLIDAQQRAQRVAADARRRGYLGVAHSMQYLAGQLEGSAGAAARKSALSFFANQGWRDPRKALRVMCPAVDHAPGGFSDETPAGD